MPKSRLDPLTYDEHVAIGAELKETRDRLTRLVIRLCRSYGVSAKATKYADQSAARLNLLRFELDNHLCQSLPPSDNSWRGVYYGEQK